MIWFKGAEKNSGYVENSRIIIEFEPEGPWNEVVATKFEVIPRSVFERNHCELWPGFSVSGLGLEIETKRTQKGFDPTNRDVS